MKLSLYEKLRIRMCKHLNTHKWCLHSPIQENYGGCMECWWCGKRKSIIKRK